MAVGGGGVGEVEGLAVETAASEKDLDAVVERGLWERRDRVRRRFQAMIFCLGV